MRLCSFSGIYWLHLSQKPFLASEN